MTKKFIMSLLVAAVLAGLVVFAYNQVAAQPPPTDAERIIKCTGANEALRLRFENGALAAAYYCTTDETGECDSEWIQLVQKTGHICTEDFLDCRLIQGAELLYWCEGPLGGCIGGGCFPKP